MAKQPDKKPRKRITKKAVQQTEHQPPREFPAIPAVAEVDESEWGQDGLTEKQRRFVHFYMGEAAGNASKAASLAGYRDDNRNALGASACETLKKPNVQRALERERGKRFGSAENVRNSLAAIANGSASDYLRADAKGKMHLDLEAMAEAGALGLLQQVQEERLEVGNDVATVKLKLKLYDRLKALELLAKMNGQLKDQVDHTGSVTLYTKELRGVSQDDL